LNQTRKRCRERKVEALEAQKLRSALQRKGLTRQPRLRLASSLATGTRS
jgi:hypothetical protein